MGMLNIDEHVEEHRLMAIRYPNKAVVLTSELSPEGLGAVPDSRAAAWGSKTDPLSGVVMIPVVQASSSNCYFWAWPGSNSTARYGEHHLYVPVGTNNAYYGWVLGVRAKSAYAVPFECVTGLFRPGLHTKASSCTRVGSWTYNNPASGALHNEYYYSTTAGNKVSATVTGDIAAAHLYLASNGGYAVVSIDGGHSFASDLPVFSDADYQAGLCRSSDVGKRYLSSYSAFAWSQTIVLAKSLSSGAHVVELELTGTKPAESSSTRIMMEALVGCSPTDSVANASTHMVPIAGICEQPSPGASAYYHVSSWAPSGSTDRQFLTSVHADNTNCRETPVSGPTVMVDGTDRSSPALGTYYGGTHITWYQESTASHKSNLATQVLNRKRTISAMARRQCPIMATTIFEWLADGTISSSYPTMLPVGAYDYTRRGTANAATALWLGDNEITSFVANDDSITLCGNQPEIGAPAHKVLAAVFADCMVWGVLFDRDPFAGQSAAANGRFLLQDRADGLDKIYVSDSYQAITTVLNGDTVRCVSGWGAAMLADMPS